MDRQERNDIRLQARANIAEAAYNPRKLMLLHTGLILLVSLLAAAVQYLLGREIDNAGGISGLGMKSLLSTAQSVLQIAQLVLIPVWEMGLLYAALQLARGRSAYPADLAAGFRRFFATLRLHLVKSGIFMIIGFISFYIGTAAFFATPFALPITQQLQPLLSDEALLQNPAALQALLTPVIEANIVPLAIFIGVVFVAISLPFYYRYRMAAYYLLDETEKGAVAALRASRKLMRFLCMDLFKLDLKFWLYYLLDLLITAVCYGDMLLPLLGIQLPFNGDAAYFIFLVAYAILQLVLYCWKRTEVEVTYAGAYCFLRNAFNPLKTENDGQTAT